MKRLGLFAATLLLMTGCTSIPEGIAPVNNLDADRYLGTWYEIARLDHSFERGLSQVTATYRARDADSISVYNRGYKAAKDEWDEALGHAHFVRNEDIGHLKVSFFGPFHFSYVIFDLDPDYQWAYVTGYNRRFLWFLSRTPQVSQAAKDHFLDRITALGYDTERLIWADQTPPEQPEKPQEP